MNILFIGLVKFEIKQWLSAAKTNFVPGLVSSILSESFSMKETALSIYLSIIFLLSASRTCSMPLQDFSATLSFAQSRTIFI